MVRSLLAALLLASPLSAQIVSVKTTIPVLTGAPAVTPFQTPALVDPLATPSLATALTPSLAPAALVPALAAPAVPITLAAAPVPVAVVPAARPSPVASLRGAVSGFGRKLAQAPASLARLFDGAASIGEPSEPVGAAAVAVRSLSSIKSLKMGSYNVLNLFENVGKHVPDPANPGKLVKVSDARPKDEASLRAQGKVILENDLDVVTLEEVENIAALNDFNENYLEGKYRVFLIEGNDERGIDVAFLVKKDLPFEIEQRSHKDETWVDPVFGGGPTKLFSRDLTSLVVRAPGKTQPLFVLFGTHFKSKRDRDGRDPESRIMRGAQVERSVEIINRYRAEFGADTPIMLAGDFNGEVPNEPEFRPLFEAAGLVDSFDATPNPPSERDRITHTFHPRGGATHKGQMDAVLVSKSLKGAVRSAKVYRYKNDDGTERPIPETYEERSKNPSDHFPVIVTLDFAPIRDGAAPAADRRPANFGEVPPLDARYATPESRAKTVTVLGSSKAVEPIRSQIETASSVSGSFIRRGWNVLSGAGNAGVMGAAYKAAADAKGPGENLVAVVRPAWGDENLADARAVAIADSEAERIEKFVKLSDNFLIFPGSAGSLQEAATLISKNAYRGKEPLKRVVLVGRDFFGGLSQQYQRLFQDGLLKDRPEVLFAVVDTAEEIMAAFFPGEARNPAAGPQTPKGAARAFADSARSWLASSGTAFDAKNAEWAAWTENPGSVNALTRGNLRAIRSLIDSLQVAKLVFAREAAAVPASGELTPEQVRRLYDAWDNLRAAGNATMIITADSLERDPAKRGLVSNVDQNTGKTPGGLEQFLAPGMAVDWDAARALNEALR